MRRLTVCLVVALALTLGLLSSGLAHADTAFHQFFYDSSGIQHSTGNLQYQFIDYQGQPLDPFNPRPVWVTDDGSTSGLYLWWGPKSTLPNDGTTSYHVCWDYLAPQTNSMVVVFDVTSSANPTHILWSSGSKVIPPVAVNHNHPFDPFNLQVFCHDVDNLIGSFTKFQVRAKVLSPNNPPLDRFQMYKTSYEGNNG